MHPYFNTFPKYLSSVNRASDIRLSDERRQILEEQIEEVRGACQLNRYWPIFSTVMSQNSLSYFGPKSTEWEEQFIFFKVYNTTAAAAEALHSTPSQNVNIGMSEQLASGESFVTARKSAAETLIFLCKAYGDNVICNARVVWLLKDFQCGSESPESR